MAATLSGRHRVTDTSSQEWSASGHQLTFRHLSTMSRRINRGHLPPWWSGRHPLALANVERRTVAGKLTPEGEVIAAYGAAIVAAFQVLINCLEEQDALLPGQFPDALGVYMEMVKSRSGGVSDMTLAVLHDLRTAKQD